MDRYAFYNFFLEQWICYYAVDDQEHLCMANNFPCDGIFMRSGDRWFKVFGEFVDICISRLSTIDLSYYDKRLLKITDIIMVRMLEDGQGGYAPSWSEHYTFSQYTDSA